MKNKMQKATFVALLVLSFGVQGQSSLYSTLFFTPQINKTIVREVASARMINYVETPTSHYFTYRVPPSGTMMIMQIPNTVFVNDFVIDNDTVFFCGNSGGWGIFGHFEIQDFFYGSHMFFYTSNAFYCDGSTVTSFDKMVSYTKGNDRMLAALGDGGTVVAEVRYNYNVQVSYTTAMLSPNIPEVFYDIAVTDHYVVTAGFRAGTYPCIRVYDRNSMFQSGGPQDIVSSFSQYGNQTIEFNPSQLVLSHLQADSFAFATYWRNVNSNNDTGTFVCMDSIMSNNQVAWLSSLVTYQFHQNGGWRLQGMTLMNSASHFYLLQHAEMQGSTSNVDLILDLTPNTFFILPSGGTVNMQQCPEPLPTMRSIDARSNGNGFVANGYNLNALPRLFDYYATTNNPNCFLDNQLPIYPVSLTKTVQKDIFHTTSGSVPVTYGYAQQLSAGVDIECEL